AALAGALDTLTHTQGTRPEGLGGSRDAGPAVAGPRPPYVTEAERHNNVGGGYAVQRLRPYGPYGPYERRNVGRFYALFFDFCRYGYSYSYSYSYGKRPCYYSPFTASSFPLERSFRPDFFGCFFRPLVFRPFLPSLFFLRPALQSTETIGIGGIRVRAESSSYNGSYNSRYNSRYNRNNSSIRTYLWPYRTRPEGLRGLRNAGPAIAGPRPPYVIKAVRYSGYIKGL
ncbi:hypothetical protein L249_7121, partial [Ophiocordyceps polyrhachis-furcata BCC 54312]